MLSSTDVNRNNCLEFACPRVPYAIPGTAPTCALDKPPMLNSSSTPSIVNLQSSLPHEIDPRRVVARGMALAAEERAWDEICCN